MRNVKHPEQIAGRRVTQAHPYGLQALVSVQTADRAAQFYRPRVALHEACLMLTFAPGARMNRPPSVL